MVEVCKGQAYQNRTGFLSGGNLAKICCSVSFTEIFSVLG